MCGPVNLGVLHASRWQVESVMIGLKTHPAAYVGVLCHFILAETIFCQETAFFYCCASLRLVGIF